MPKLSVIVPVYWNEQSLSPLFARLLEIEKGLYQEKVELELIFVDDGSGDNSLQELLKIKQKRPSTRVIKLSRNFGAIHASKTGAQFVTGDAFLMLAADLQDPPELILEMVERWQAGTKFVICVRRNRDDPLLSRIFASIYYGLVRLYVIKDYPKGGFDLALMDKVMLPYLQNSGKFIYTPLFMHSLGFRSETIYYDRQKRLYGHSRWTFQKKLIASLDVLLGFSVIPIRIMSLIGLAVSTISFCYGAWIITNAFLGRVDVRGFATIIAILSFLLGTIILMLGIIGEYLWRIFEEVNKRPEVVIEAIY